MYEKTHISKPATAINSKDIKETFESLIYSLESSSSAILTILDLNKKQLDKLYNVNTNINHFIDRLEQIIIDVKDFHDESYNYNYSYILF